MRSKSRDTKESISFRKQILAGTNDVLHERIKGQGTIEGMRVRFYPGQQLDLQVRVFVEHKGGLMEELVTYPSTTRQYLAGDDDNVIIDCVISVENDDFLKVSVVNVDLVNNYDLAVDVYVDYYGGSSRVVGGVL